MTIAAATFDLMVQCQTSLLFVLERKLSHTADTPFALLPSETVVFTRQLLEGVVQIVSDGGISDAPRASVIAALDQLGRDNILRTFRIAFSTALGDRALPIIVNAWSEIIFSCCKLEGVFGKSNR